ncbi:hypothetical protein D3C85_15820 [compost metagenome]
MSTFPMTGKPGRPYRDFAIVLLLLLIVWLPGCASRQYHAVPECEVIPPPKATRFIEAGVDEKLVLMSNSYIAASKAAASCNNQIRIINASNEAIDRVN